MIKSSKIFVVSAAVLCAYVVSHAYAVGTAPAVLSQYGQIQAVKNYSSNPFWNPNSPYNMKNIPKPIYVTGADLTTADCNRIVEGLVSDYCSMNNNCADMQLSDVRPYIMVTLSQLPGHNYATACGGYIDAAFDKYAQTSITIAAPLTTNTTTNHYTFQNPYAPKLNAYQAGVQERTKELEQLQAQTGTSASLSATSFPKTVADLTLTDRMANAAAGYEPYKDKSAYKIPKFETEEDFLARTTKPKKCSDPVHMTPEPDCKCLTKGAVVNSAGNCVCAGYVGDITTLKECPKQNTTNTNPQVVVNVNSAQNNNPGNNPNQISFGEVALGYGMYQLEKLRTWPNRMFNRDNTNTEPDTEQEIEQINNIEVTENTISTAQQNDTTTPTPANNDPVFDGSQDINYDISYWDIKRQGDGADTISGVAACLNSDATAYTQGQSKYCWCRIQYYTTTEQTSNPLLVKTFNTEDECWRNCSDACVDYYAIVFLNQD